MRYRKLGKTDLEISVVSMGCMAFWGGEGWSDKSEADGKAALKAAMDAGVNLFDTAEMYGDGFTESFMGRALKDVRKDILIGSKVMSHHLKADDLVKACEDSLARLQTDYLDLYQIHWANWDVPMEETVGAMEKLKADGKVRVTGVSNFGVRDLTDFLSCGSRPEFNQLPYNLLWRAIDHEVRSFCLENQVSILCYFPMLMGLLAGKYKRLVDMPEKHRRTRHFSTDNPQARHGEKGAEELTQTALEGIQAVADELGISMSCLSLGWLIQREGVCSVLAGGRNAEQIKGNVPAGDLELAPEVMEKLDAITSPLMEALGRNVDPWQSDSRIR